tara:strand:- start:7 stop:498 length:492 start_codon:yes stop_codon:yes gene_type:complete
MKFTDTHYEEFISQGYTILNDALPEEKCVAIAQGLRSCIAPWDDIKDNPPEHRSAMQGFPFPSLALNRFFVEPDLVAFVQRLFGSENIQYRPGIRLRVILAKRLGATRAGISTMAITLCCPSQRTGAMGKWSFGTFQSRLNGSKVLSVSYRSLTKTTWTTSFR